MEILHDDVMCRERLAKRAVEERKKEKKAFSCINGKIN